MSAFTDFAAFERVASSNKLYVTTATCAYEIVAKGTGWWLKIAADETFDISVPWWLEWLQSPHDPKVLLAALIHDRLLKDGRGVLFSSSEFRRACMALGTNRWWAWVLFAVTLFWTGIKRRV